MKLHLPKMLLTAVLAVCIAQDAWAGWANGTYYINGKPEDKNVVSSTQGDSFNVMSGNIATYTMESFTMKDGQTMTIAYNSSNNKNIENLSISSLIIGDGTGTAKVNINASQTASIESVSGNLNLTVSGTLGRLGNVSGDLNVSFKEGSKVDLVYAIVHASSGIYSEHEIINNASVSGTENISFVFDGREFNGATVSSTDSGITISGISQYHVAKGDTKSLSAAKTAIGSTTVNHIQVNGILSSVTDNSIGTNTPSIIGVGTVQVDGMLEDKTSTLADFSGTIELMNGGKIHFGQNANQLTNIEQIKINSGAYITGWGDPNKGGSTFQHNLLLNGGSIQANIGSIWNGNIHVAADSSIGMYNSTTISGAITAESGKTLSIVDDSLGGNNTNTVLTLNGTVGKLDGGTLDVRFGTVYINGRSDGNALIAGAIKVGAGATLEVAGSDTLGYKNANNTLNYTDSITAEGTSTSLAKIKFSATQTMSTNLILKGNTEMTGSTFNSFGGKVTVSGTNNTIKNSFSLRENITFDVAANGSLAMEGAWTDFERFSGAFTKSGAGEMTVTGGITSSRTFNVYGGKLNLGGTNTMNNLDMSNGNNATGTLTIKENASLTVNENMWLGRGESNKILLEKGGSYSQGATKVIGIDKANTSINRNELDNSDEGADVYSIGNHRFNINNAAVEVTASGTGSTIKNQLNNSSITNKGTALLTVDNELNTYTGVNAEAGSIDIINFKQQTAINSLTIASKDGKGNHLGIYTAGVGSAVANVSANALTMDSVSSLSANLTLTDGATLTLNGYGKENTATITGDLTLGAELKLAGEEFLKELGTLEAGEMLKILNVQGTFSGLEADLSIAADAIMEATPLLKSIVDANTYFSSLNVENYKLLFENGALYIQYVNPIPEPTTRALSLLALAALAARRRRK